MASFRTLIAPLEQRVGRIEDRVRGIEDTLNEILKRLSPPSLHKEDAGLSVEKTLFDAKTGPYLYRPLDASRSEIRILVLYGSLEEQDPIACELLHANLDHNPLKDPANRSSMALEKFNTLSYTWGSLEKKGFITIEGYQFPVTENLEAALRHMRNFKGQSKVDDTPIRSFWWIDAICINQDDILERNQQVNLMTRIYKKAAGVHIWLGQEADNSELALDVVRQVGDSTLRGPGEPDIVYPEITADRRDIHWKALTALFERPWWERVWVRQEVAVAREATIHCGNQTCTFTALAITADILQKIDEQLGFNPIQQDTAKSSEWPTTAGIIGMSSYLRACSLAGFRQDMGSMPNIAFRDLKDLIFHTRSCEATDLRDKVFSVLGLVDPEFWELKADYRLSIRDTLTAAAQCMISRKQSLDVLSGYQNPKRLNGLPSWVPNLVDEWKARPFTVQRHLEKLTFDDEPDFAFEGEGNNILRVKGRRMDIITILSDDTPIPNATTEELDTLSANWKAFAAMTLSNPTMFIPKKSIVEGYKNDGSWVQFLSAGADIGQPSLQTETPLKTRGNYQMAKSLLLPKDGDESAVKVSGMRRRVHENLRKFGVGRRLCLTKTGHKKGSVVLVPADAKADDEIWVFRGTGFPYVLRKMGDEGYVVVGEAWSARYAYPSTYKNLVFETISIV